MAKSYARPEDLTRKLKLIGSEFSDVDLQAELEESNRWLRGALGSYFRQHIFAEASTQRAFQVVFSPLLSVNSVWKDRIQISASDYTSDLDTGIVTFGTVYANQSVGEGDVFEFRYVPEIFIDLEVLKAVENILLMNTVITSSEEKRAKTQEVINQRKALQNQINQRGAMYASQDHKPFF